MALPVRKGYTGNGIQTTVLSGLTSSTETTSTFTVATDALDWPATSSSSAPFYVVVDPGTSREEKMLVTTLAGSSVTATRGVDNTTKKTHDPGAVIYPVFSASEANEANLVASAMISKGDLIATDGSSISRLPIGSNNFVLQADSTVTHGFKWGQITSAGITNGTIVGEDIASGTITLDKLATALQAFLVPVGTINAYAGATAPTGWLLCDGTSTTGYTALAALVGATTPNLVGRVPMGKTGTGTGSTLLGSGGTNVIASTNLPTHAHSLDHNHAAFDYTHDHGSFNTADGGSHTHAISDPGHSHTIGVDNAGDFTGSAAYGVYTADVNISTSSVGTGISVTSTSSAHAHAIDVPSHTGSVDVPAFSGTVTTTFANDPLFQPFVAVNYIIKHD